MRKKSNPQIPQINADEEEKKKEQSDSESVKSAKSADAARPDSTLNTRHSTLPNSAFRIPHSAFIVVDIQDWPRKVWTAENILPEYVDLQFTLDELNAAQRHLHEVCVPNTLRLLEFFRGRDVPIVFLHWAGGRVHPSFNPRPGEAVLPKTERDAFGSSEIESVLGRIQPRTLWMCGGHTKGCLGDTAKSALARGYEVICIRDATFDCSYLRWPEGIAMVPYTAVLNTAAVLAR